MMKLELLDNKIFKDAFDSISKIVDEVVCKVDEEGFHITAIDRSHICFVALDLQPTVFDEFICDVPEKLCIDTIEFMRILKRMKSDDVLSLSNDEGNLIINLKGEVNRTFKIRLIDMDYENPPAPTLELPCAIKIGSEIVKDALTDMELFSEKLYFTINEEEFIVTADGEFGDVKFEYPHGEDISETVKSSYTIDKLKNIFIASKFSDEVEISLGSDMPIILDFELVTGDGRMQYLLAPRIENEE